jgi:hypothetical protein
LDVFSSNHEFVYQRNDQHNTSILIIRESVLFWGFIFISVIHISAYAMYHIQYAACILLDQSDTAMVLTDGKLLK